MTVAQPAHAFVMHLSTQRSAIVDSATYVHYALAAVQRHQQTSTTEKQNTSDDLINMSVKGKHLIVRGRSCVAVVWQVEHASICCYLTHSLPKTGLASRICVNFCCVYTLLLPL
jgi:hypothetical protein